MSETWVQSLGWEDHLEKRMAIHSSFLAYRIPWTEEPGVLQSIGSQRIGHDWMTKHGWMWNALFMEVIFKWEHKPVSLEYLMI